MILRYLFALNATLATIAIAASVPAAAVPPQDMPSDCRAEAARAFNVIFRRIPPDHQTPTVEGNTVVATIDFGTPAARRIRCDYNLYRTLIGVRLAPPEMVVW